MPQNKSGLDTSPKTVSQHRITTRSQSQADTVAENNVTENHNMGDKGGSVTGKKKTLDDLFAKLGEIQTDIRDIKQSLEFTQASVKENTDNIAALQAENALLWGEHNELKQKFSKLQDRVESTEQREREFSVRIFGIKQTQPEDARKIVADIISKNKLDGIDTPEKADAIVEHCHRLSISQADRDAGKSPGIIVRFFSRPQRFRILKQAKASINRSGQGVYMVEDLTAEDHYKKRAARKQMQEAHNLKQKVSFRRGKLYINSQNVPINFPPKTKD